MNKAQWLRGLCLGDLNEYPFIETGNLGLLRELIADGLVLRIPNDGDFAIIRITEKGRAEAGAGQAPQARST
jgi:hypothetical protein